MTGRVGWAVVVVILASHESGTHLASDIFKCSLAELQGKSTLHAYACAARREPAVTTFTDKNLRRGISVADEGMGVTHREGGGR
jgi:hypothetical protein